MPGIPLARDLPRLIYHRRALSKELLLIAVTGPVFSPYGLKIKLAPRARFELATLRLTAECSTVELPGNAQRACFHSITRNGIRHDLSVSRRMLNAIELLWIILILSCLRSPFQKSLGTWGT